MFSGIDIAVNPLFDFIIIVFIVMEDRCLLQL